MDIAAIAAEINLRAPSRPIGALHTLRAQLKHHKKQLPARLFNDQTIHADYAFHVGGRSELQFNFGSDAVEGLPVLRHGVAFSFETSQSLPSIEVLLPKVARFNEFLRVYPDACANCRMWHFDHGKRSGNYSPSMIPPELCRNEVFVFVGQWSDPHEVDVEKVLDTFDQLLPLYNYVEGDQDSFPSEVTTPSDSAAAFRPGCTIKMSSTTATLSERSLDIALRHNDVQLA